MSIDEQVKMQIKLVKHYAQDYLDMPSFSENIFRETIKDNMKAELQALIDEEKYEMCAIYRDAIDNIKYISLKLLL